MITLYENKKKIYNYKKGYFQNNPEAKLTNSIRNKVANEIVKGIRFMTSTMKYLGCNFNEYSEYLKNLFRYVKKQDKLVSVEYLFGHLQAMQSVLNGASVILPNSGSELKRIQKDIGYDGAFLIVPNGIDEEIFGKFPENIQRRQKVICVAQIYGMKNQLQLIRVCKKTVKSVRKFWMLIKPEKHGQN